MNPTIWMALGLVLVLEGLGPMLFPTVWRKMIGSLTTLPDPLLRRFGGGLVVAGCVIYYIWALDRSAKKQRKPASKSTESRGFRW